MSLESVVNSVRNYLSSYHMNVDNEWLSGCVEFLYEDTANTYSQNDIKNLAKEQWLLNDLKDICPGCLPVNLKNVPKTTLNGRFVVQINGTIDIGTPAYQQYLKLQKVNMENVEATVRFEDKVPSHRMLKLFITDGVQEISAIEYQSMRNISCDIVPGCKALIKGPIECRRGILMLTENSLELLGGEVQEISTSRSLAGLLSTKLGLPITQISEVQNSTVNHLSNPDIPMLHTEMPSARTLSVIHPETIDQTCNRPVARVTSLQVAHNFIDDDIDIDQLAAIEAQITDNPSKRSLPIDTPKPEKKIKMDHIVAVNKEDDYPNELDMFCDEDADYLREMEANFDAKDFPHDAHRSKDPVLIKTEPFVYIKQINDLRPSDRAGRVFRVKGQIMKLLSKLSVGKEGWSLKCTIVDGTGSIDVDFTSDVLSKLVGFTPQEMNLLKKDMATKPELKQKAVMALQKAKDTLQVLYCIIELTILETPRITCLTSFDETHLELLRERTQNNSR